MPSPNCEHRDKVPDRRLSWPFGNGANRTLPVSGHRPPDLSQASAVSVRLEEQTKWALLSIAGFGIQKCGELLARHS